ncbi:hypothetical protein EV361DRAFT_811297 [Lentinula raphanica]|nr:hypothetical protein C8R42DRAFT_591295 [Lentinula raphanica]KAJ3965066.1 hypothetical protein EV361DRAFT_811297 [Lentinula raphanica]
MSRAPGWKETLNLWLQLEALHGFTKRGKGLPTTSRPVAVGNWVKSYRIEKTENIPKGVGKAEEFGSEVLKWWRFLNPSWRTPSPTGTFLRVGEGDWEALEVYGANGFLSVLGCMTWWQQRAEEERIIDDRWFVLKEDLDWVLKQQILQLDPEALSQKKQRTA